MFNVSSGSFLTLLMSEAATMPKTRPSKVPPIVKLNSKNMIFFTGILLPATISAQIVNKTIQVPSLSKDSPSMSELNFFGAPTSFNSANTATVSVQLRMAPKRKAPTHVNS